MRRAHWKVSLTALMLFTGAWQGVARADVLSFVGNLRDNANVPGGGYLLSDMVTDLDFAQFTGFAATFTVSAASSMEAITFSYGGGTNGQGTAISEGGFSPYLSLFDASGKFLGSTFGTHCPPGANANSVSGNCYDALLDGGTLAPGDYQIVISAFENMSYAENYGVGTLADGLIGLGNLDGTGSTDPTDPSYELHYAFDVILGTPQTPAVPEPASLWLLAPVVLTLYKIRGRRTV